MLYRTATVQDRSSKEGIGLDRWQGVAWWSRKELLPAGAAPECRRCHEGACERQPAAYCVARRGTFVGMTPATTGMTQATMFEFEFHARNQIAGLPKWHHCHQGDGHRYEVTFEVADSLGLLAGQAQLAERSADALYSDHQVPDPVADVRAWFAELDGQLLNDRMDAVPTEENISMWLFRVWAEHYPGLRAVTIQSEHSVLVEYRAA